MLTAAPQGNGILWKNKMLHIGQWIWIFFPKILLIKDTLKEIQCFKYYIHCVGVILPIMIKTTTWKKEYSFIIWYLNLLYLYMYLKVSSSRLSRLGAHLRIFKQFMKRKIDAYVLWHLAKRVQNSRPVYCSRLYGM